MQLRQAQKSVQKYMLLTAFCSYFNMIQEGSNILTKRTNAQELQAISISSCGQASLSKQNQIILASFPLGKKYFNSSKRWSSNIIGKAETYAAVVNLFYRIRSSKLEPLYRGQ